jgi:hypothetical protein
MKTPEEIARNCVIQYCTPDEYDAAVKSAIAAAIRAERDQLTARTELLQGAARFLNTLCFDPIKSIQLRDARIDARVWLSNPSVREMTKGEGE